MKTYWLLIFPIFMLLVGCSSDEKEEKSHSNTPCEFKIHVQNSSDFDVEYKMTYNGHSEYATLVSNTSSLTPLKYECKDSLQVDFDFKAKKTECTAKNQHIYNKSYKSNFIKGKTIDVLINDRDSCSYNVIIEVQK